MTEPTQSADYERARPLAQALADVFQRWDDEGDDDVTFQEAYEVGWSLSEFIALALVRDGWRFER